MGLARIAELEQWVHPHLQPDRTWLFDVPLEIARERLDRTREKDRFELEADTFFLRTRAVYLARAANQSERFTVVDATASIDDIRQSLTQQLDALIAQSRQA
jgi:dTMP kinase